MPARRSQRQAACGRRLEPKGRPCGGDSSGANEVPPPAVSDERRESTVQGRGPARPAQSYGGDPDEGLVLEPPDEGDPDEGLLLEPPDGGVLDDAAGSTVRVPLMVGVAPLVGDSVQPYVPAWLAFMVIVNEVLAPTVWVPTPKAGSVKV